MLCYVIIASQNPSFRPTIPPTSNDYSIRSCFTWKNSGRGWR